MNWPKIFKPSRKQLLSDMAAGLTLAALGIPEVMGYTKIIGTPVITGLYTMVFPLLCFALLGSSRHLVVAADSATAAIVASALAGLSLAPEDYVGTTSLVALMAAVMLVLARFARLGFLANFLSRTVLVGFLTGVGIQVAIGELHGMLGLDKSGSGFFSSLADLARQLPHLQLPSALIAAVVLIFIFTFSRWERRFPAALVIVVVMIASSYFFDFAHFGIKLVGDIPAGLPGFVWPHADRARVLSLLSVSFSCGVVILAQSAATSRAFANRYQEDFSENADLLGLGAANLAAALSGTFVVNGSPTKTAILDSAGGRSQYAHVVTALLVMLVLLFFTKPLSFLPEAVLAAIVFRIGVSLIDLAGLKDIARRNRREFWLAALTAASVVAVGVMQGILLAFALSLALHVERSYRPSSSLMIRGEYGRWFPQSVGSLAQVVPGFLVYWYGADLFYANSGHFVTELKGLVARSADLKWLVIDAGAITDVDYTAGQALLELAEYLKRRKIQLVWVHVSSDLAAQLHSLKIAQGRNAFATLHEALDAYRST